MCLIIITADRTVDIIILIDLKAISYLAFSNISFSDLFVLLLCLGFFL